MRTFLLFVLALAQAQAHSKSQSSTHFLAKTPIQIELRMEDPGFDLESRVRVSLLPGNHSDYDWKSKTETYTKTITRDPTRWERFKRKARRNSEAIFLTLGGLPRPLTAKYSDWAHDINAPVSEKKKAKRTIHEGSDTQLRRIRRGTKTVQLIRDQRFEVAAKEGVATHQFEIRPETLQDFFEKNQEWGKGVLILERDLSRVTRRGNSSEFYTFVDSFAHLPIELLEEVSASGKSIVLNMSAAKIIDDEIYHIPYEIVISPAPQTQRDDCTSAKCDSEVSLRDETKPSAPIESAKENASTAESAQ